MPVCSIVKLLPLGTVDDLMHYCTRPSALGNSASGRPRHLGVIVWTNSIQTSRTVLAYKTWFCLFSVYRNPFIMFWSHFFVLKLGVYVCLVKSLLILSFYLSKQLKESSRTKNLGVKRL